ncbi:MAG TPA: hypothetical protein VIF64_18425 [Pyrinomonadaceae bacterium]
MLHPRYLLPTIAFILTLVSVASAQSGAPEDNSHADTAPVTATATAARVRLAAPNAVAQLRLEVYTAAGQKIFDTEQRGGNVLDWMLQDGGGERLIPGSYLCVVTVKSLSGKLSRRIGSALVQEKEVELQLVDATQLTALQQQAVGRIEENGALIILKTGESQATTVLANDGKEGQIIRGQGALSFRMGDFFSGNDREQMRLTEDGQLGIGTDNPQATLDVKGTVRASKGVEFADGTVQTTGLSGRKDKDGNLVPNVAGTGTTNQVAKWTDTAGTLGDSTITEVGGRVGIGVTNPTYKLVVGSDIGPGLTTSDLTISRGVGQSVSIFAGASGSNGMNFGWDEANKRAFVNAPVQTPITFIHGGVSERMRIAPSGNVGIGVSSPNSKLDVAGAINTSTQFSIGGKRVLSVTGARGNIDSNTFAGVGAGASNTPGDSTSSGNNNSFFGLSAGGANTNGFGNSFFGSQAGSANTIGSGNSFFGDSAGSATTAGNNSFFGRSAGSSNTTGAQISLFGAFANTADGLTNASAIGFRAFVGQSNSLVLGGSNGVNGAQADTNVGIGTTTPARHLHVFGAGDQQIGIESSDSGGRQWTLQSSKGSSDGRFEIVDRTAGVNRFTILSNGNVGIGTTAPDDRLAVAGGAIFGGRLAVGGRLTASANIQDFTFPDQPFNHVVAIENTSTGKSAVNVLSLKVGYPGGDNSLINYITFYRDGNEQTGDLPVGAIKGNGFTGVSYNSSGSDYAEWLPRLNPAERIQPGEIVGLFDGRITRKTRGAAQVFAVSTGPVVLGNDPGDKARSGYERVAFIGQVLARVRGAVRAGDFIIASGLDDGTGIAVSPERISAEQFAQVVGQAWESSADTGLKSVRVAVGLARRDPTVSRLLTYSRQQSARLVALEARLNGFEARLRSKHTSRYLAIGRRRKASRTLQASARM